MVAAPEAAVGVPARQRFETVALGSIAAAAETDRRRR
jgi:hypothetical protein